MSTYAGRYAERNASAAKDWAAERQAKIEHAKRLREERKRGALSEDCTFVPQRFNNVQPSTGSSGMQSTSEYSQDFINDFHYDPTRTESTRDETSMPLYSLNRKTSAGSVSSKGSVDSFGINHAPVPRKGRMSYAGQAIVSQHAPHSQYLVDTSDPSEYERKSSSPRFDSLSNEMHRHGRQEPARSGLANGSINLNNAMSNNNNFGDAYVNNDLSYEFAATASPHVGMPRQRSRNQFEHDLDMNIVHAQTMPASRQTSTPVSANNLESDNLGGASRLVLLKNKLASPSATRRRTPTRSAGNSSTSRPRMAATMNPATFSSTTSSSVSAPASVPTMSMPRQQSHVLDVCTRQSGCACSQCNAHLSYQPPSDTHTSASCFGQESNEGQARGAKKKKKSSRPPWNSDFATPEDEVLDNEQGVFGNVNPEPEVSDIREPRMRPNRRGQTNSASRRRSEWRGPLDDGPESRDSPDPMSARKQASRDPFAVDAMRRELRGDNEDFIDQMHSSKQKQTYNGIHELEQGTSCLSAPQPRHTSSNLTEKRGPRSRQPQPQSNYRQQTGAAPAQAPYRGMFMPGAEAEASPHTEQPRTSLDDIPANGQSASDSGNEIPEYAPPEPLFPCSSCGRKFRKTVLTKHSKVCNKVFMQKRETFDAKNARLQDVMKNPEDARTLQNAQRETRPSKSRAVSKVAPAKPAKKGNKWKQQSQALREAMKYNRMLSKAEAEGRDISSIPPAPSSVADNDLVPCPHCGRTFNEKAAERHIPRCKDTKAKPTRLVRGSGNNAMRGRMQKR